MDPAKGPFGNNPKNILPHLCLTVQLFEPESVEIEPAAGQENKRYGTHPAGHLNVKGLYGTAVAAEIGDFRHAVSFLTGNPDGNGIHVQRRFSFDFEPGFAGFPEIHAVECERHVVADLAYRGTVFPK